MGSPVDRSIYRKIAHFLLEGHDKDAADLLLTCSLAIDWTRVAAQDVYTVQIGAPRRAYEILSQRDHPLTQDIRHAFEAFLLPGLVNYDLTPEMADHEEAWKADVRAEIAGYESGESQVDDGATMWQGVPFHSAAEVRVAQALDRVGALYLPNPTLRLGPAEQRETSTATFVVCHQGRWGILQIRAEHQPYDATPQMQQQDLLSGHGIRTIQRYFPSRCISDPDEVVQEFLGLLAEPE